MIVFVEHQGAKHQEDETPRSSGRELIVAEIADSAHAPQQLHESLYAHNHEQHNSQYSNSLWQNLEHGLVQLDLQQHQLLRSKLEVEIPWHQNEESNCF